jgi:hypothetical protein
MGSDTIAKQHIHLIPEQIKRLLENNPGKDIVVDGNKCSSRPIFNAIMKLVPSSQLKLYWIKCTPEVSYIRNKRNDSTCSFTHLKSVCTRTMNLFFDYEDKMNGEIIDTTNITDFSTFSIDNLPESTNTGLW